MQILLQELECCYKVKCYIYVSGESDDTLGYKNMPNHTHFVQHNDDIYVEI